MGFITKGMKSPTMELSVAGDSQKPCPRLTLHFKVRRGRGSNQRVTK